MTKILVLSDETFEFTPSMLMHISETGAEVEYFPADHARNIESAEVVFGCPPVEFLKKARALKWHHLPNAAIQPYTSPSLYADGSVILTTSSGVYGVIIAEHIVAQVFALARNFPLYAKQQREQVWKRDNESALWVSGATAAIFGMGDLGRNAARVLKTLGMRIIGVKRSLFDRPQYVDELYDLRAMDDVLSRADFVICCLPITDATRGLFGAREFELMNPWAYFINVGRGAIADTDALVGALRDRRIAGAALDVTDPEPLPEGHPLWELDNVILTPHSSCVCSDIQKRKLVLFLEQLKRYQSGRKLKNTVDFMRGY